MEPREEFLLLSFEVALQGVESGDGGPFGAVIVRGDDVLASAHNQVVATNDPTAHAEIGAIRAACARLGSFQLDECDLYSSCEPCPMCLGAIYWARPRAVFFSATRAGRGRGRLRRRVRLRGARAAAGRAHAAHAPRRAPRGGRAVRRLGGEARPRRYSDAAHGPEPTPARRARRPRSRRR